MRAAVCFDNLKQAALYFDRVIPVSLRKAGGTGTDFEFYFPERIPSRAIINIIFDDESINSTDNQRYTALGKILDSWDEFTKSISPFKYHTAERSTDESYKLLRAAYLENHSLPNIGTIRSYFQKYAKALGVSNSDVLVPSSQKSVGVESEVQTLSFTGLELIDVNQASWGQIIEIRNDKESRKKLQKLRAFLNKNYTNKSASFIEDDISSKLYDYEIVRRKHGFDAVSSSISLLLDSKNIQAVAAAGIGAAFFGGPLVGISSVAAIELSTFAIEFAKRRKTMEDWQSSHEFAYLIELESKLTKDSTSSCIR